MGVCSPSTFILGQYANDEKNGRDQRGHHLRLSTCSAAAGAARFPSVTWEQEFQRGQAHWRKLFHGAVVQVQVQEERQSGPELGLPDDAGDA